MNDSTGKVPRLAVVTGATGLLGSNIVRALLAGGGEVTAIVRDPERARQLLPRADGLRLLAGDMRQVEGFASALRGVDAVFHTAAYFREYYQPTRDLALLRRINVDAVGELLRAASGAGVPTVVHISSSSAIDPPPGGVAATEDTPLLAHARNGYTASKVQAEDLVRAFREDHAMRVPVIVPGWMWGPGDAGPTSAGRLFLSIARRQLRAIPDAGNHMVDARDVAAACVRAAVDGCTGRYIVGGVWRSLPEICFAVARATGVPPPRVVPMRVALSAVTVMEFQARLRGRQPTATRTGVRALIEGNRRRVSSARAEKEFGIASRPLEETLQDEAAWYHEHGLLAKPVS